MLTERQKEIVRNLSRIERKGYTTQHLCEILKQVYTGGANYSNLSNVDQNSLENAVAEAIYNQGE